MFSGLPPKRCSLALLCPAISWDVHALEALRVDRLLHDAALLCFVDECRECSLRRGRAAFRQRGRHANHRKAASAAMVGLSGIRIISAALISRVSTRSEGAPRIVPIFTPALSTEAISGNSFPGAAT